MNVANICAIIGCIFFALGGVLNSVGDRPLIGVAMILIAIANLILMTQ